MKGTQEVQSPYPSGDKPVELVGFMPVRWLATQGTVCTGAQRKPAQNEPLFAQPSLAETQFHPPSQTHLQFICPRCPRENTYQGTAANATAHQREAHPGEENSLLDKHVRPLQTTHRSNRFGFCRKCGDLPINLSWHSSGCNRTPSGRYLRIPMDWVANSLRDSQPHPRHLQWKVPTKANSLQRVGYHHGE